MTRPLRPVSPASVPAVLWHGTSIMAALAILRENQMTHAQFEGPPGISFSSDVEVALDFGSRGDERVAEERLGLDVHNLGGVLIRFDGAAMAASHPFVRHFYDRDEEAEWRLLAERVPDIDQFFSGIFVDTDDLTWWKSKYPELGEEMAALAGMATGNRDVATEPQRPQGPSLTWGL